MSEPCSKCNGLQGQSSVRLGMWVFCDHCTDGTEPKAADRTTIADLEVAKADRARGMATAPKEKP
jgi:hypothetical protein